MDHDWRDDAQPEISPAGGTSGDERTRLAARAYRPVRVEIDEALRHNWLELWFQPKIDLRTRRFVGAEALARIRHPELGVLLPRSFLPAISEDNVVRLTEHAVLTALRNWSSFDRAGFNLQLAINVPITVLLQFDFANLIETNRPPAKHWAGLILEVKHDQFVLELERAQQTAARLRPLGVLVSIDNFDGRYGSFVHLRSLEFAEIKLHHDLVRNCATNSTNAVVCHTAIEFAHRHRVVVAAEGIENGADMQALRRMACDLGQGVLIAPPLPMDGFLDILQQRVSEPAALSAADVSATPRLSVNHLA
jgi:EAL domain-containing protein (putative c-di-GMP-specific phosphodiesterase class I)